MRTYKWIYESQNCTCCVIPASIVIGEALKDLRSRPLTRRLLISQMSSLSHGFIFVIAIELCLFAFHLSVFACILRNRAKGNAVFSTGFYTIYIMQSVADYVGHWVVRR